MSKASDRDGDREDALAYVRRAFDAGEDIGPVAKIGLRAANAAALRELEQMGKAVSS